MKYAAPADILKEITRSYVSCDVVMNKGTIGFKGGCNPIPFEYKVHDQKIKIDIEVLENLSYVFK